MVDEGLLKRFPSDAAFALHNEPLLPFRRAARPRAVAAAIFWVKARCGWRETTVSDLAHSYQLTKEQRDAASAAALVADL